MPHDPATTARIPLVAIRVRSFEPGPDVARISLGWLDEAGPVFVPPGRTVVVVWPTDPRGRLLPAGRPEVRLWDLAPDHKDQLRTLVIGGWDFRQHDLFVESTWLVPSRKPARLDRSRDEQWSACRRDVELAIADCTGAWRRARQRLAPSTGPGGAVWLDLTPRDPDDSDYQDPCCVYLLSKPGMLKIGISVDPEDRANDLSNACGEDVRVLYCLRYASREKARSVEFGLHGRFAEHRLRGEWFRDVAEIRDHFAGLADGSLP